MWIFLLYILYVIITCFITASFDQEIFELIIVSDDRKDTNKHNRRALSFAIFSSLMLIILNAVDYYLIADDYNWYTLLIASIILGLIYSFFPIFSSQILALLLITTHIRLLFLLQFLVEVILIIFIYIIAIVVICLLLFFCGAFYYYMFKFTYNEFGPVGTSVFTIIYISFLIYKGKLIFMRIKNFLKRKVSYCIDLLFDIFYKSEKILDSLNYKILELARKVGYLTGDDIIK